LRVIEQIVNYLSRRGALTPEQLSYLQREGFWRPPDVADADEGPQPFRFDDELLDDDPAFALQEALERAELPSRAGRSRQRRSALHRTRAEQCATLCASLAGQIPRWEAELDGLLEIGRRLAGEAGSDQLLSAIRAAPLATLAVTLPAALDARQPPFDRLWSGLSFEGYREPLADPAIPVPIARAYRALLEVAGVAIVRHNGWMLREREIRWIAELLRAQRAVMAALGRFDDGPGGPLSRWLRRDVHLGAYWALAIAYSARRADRLALEDHRPRRKPPDPDDWMRAWAQALALDSGAVTPFFATCFGAHGEDEAVPEPAELDLRCPEEWDR
jgi:hypothetical protein